MSVEIQNYLIPYRCTNKQPYNVFGDSGVNIAHFGPESRTGADQARSPCQINFRKSGLGEGPGRAGNCWSFSSLHHHFALFFIPLPLPNCPFSYARAFVPNPMPLCPCPYTLAPMLLHVCPCPYALALYALAHMSFLLCPFPYALNPMPLPSPLNRFLRYGNRENSFPHLPLCPCTYALLPMPL